MTIKSEVATRELAKMRAILGAGAKINCSTCEHANCPEPSTRKRNPPGGCVAWENADILDFIKKIPVIKTQENGELF